MNPNIAASSETHYHIRWVWLNALDWERHDTHAQAEESAKQLSRPAERYVIEQFNEACVRCRTKARSAHQ